jgi:hypothetical protein
MPDWLPPLVITVAALALIVWLVELVVPGWLRAWLSGESLPAAAPRRSVSRPRTIATWGAAVLAASVLVWLFTFVFSASTPS